MEEVFPSLEQIGFWQAVANHQPVDWKRVFAGYASQVDWPGAHVWRELAEAYPGAKVIHTVRSDESWWKSFSGTIGKRLRINRGMDLPAQARVMSDVVMEIVGLQTFGGEFADKSKALAAYHKREHDVRSAIPAERLLVFNVAEGWDPLCRFLGVAVPEVPFPRTNSRYDFWAKFGGEPRE